MSREQATASSLPHRVCSRWVFLFTAHCLLIPLTGCGPKNYLNDNDRLRRENLELGRQVERLESTLQSRLRQIEALREAAHGADLPAGTDPPMVSGLQIDTYSGPVDTDHDGIDDVVRLYLLPTDQKGRMLPVSGTMTVALLSVPDQGAPEVWVERTFTPTELDDAYRDGFTGSYYVCELPLPDPDADGGRPDQVAARCVLQPAGGATVRAQATYRVRITAAAAISP